MLCNILTKLILSLLIVSMLFGCATTNHGYGVIIAERKVTNLVERQNYLKNQVKHDAKTAGTTGVIGGGIAGGTFVLLISLIGGGSVLAGETLGVAAVFAGMGALTFGLAGVAVGGAAGYIIEKSNAKSDLYQFAVRSSTDITEIYTIRQYSPLIPLNTKVKILERNGAMFIRKN